MELKQLFQQKLYSTKVVHQPKIPWVHHLKKIPGSQVTTNKAGCHERGHPGLLQLEELILECWELLECMDCVVITEKG